jgi:ribosomal protein L7/L12
MDVSSVDHEIHELKRRVAKLESQVAFMLRDSGFDFPEPSMREVSPEIVDLVRRGRKTEAIKLFRQETGAGLKDAKRFIESLEV